jgi:hypothetical protein
VAPNGHLIEIIHAGAAKVAVGNRKTRGFDDMGRDIQARAQAQDRPGVLGDVGLEKCNLHLLMALRLAMKCLNKSSLCADLVHCTLASR